MEDESDTGNYDERRSPVFRFFVNEMTLSFSNSNHINDKFEINNFIYKSITAGFQFYFIMIFKSGKFG